MRILKHATLWPGWASANKWASRAVRYGLALLLTLGALVLRQLFPLSFPHPLLITLNIIAIALSGALGGLGPGLFATLLSAVLTLYWFVEPRGSLAFVNTLALGGVIAILAIGGLVSILVAALYRSRRQTGEQANRFQAIFEKASQGMLLVDPETGRFILANRKLSEITGYSERELPGMTFRHLTYPEDRQEAEVALKKLARGEVPDYKAERRYVQADGRLIWVELLLTMVRAADGRPLYVFAGIQDITRRKQMEVELRESEARYRQVIRSAGCAIVGLDMTGRITLYGGQARQIFGYTEEEVLGRHVVGTIIPPCDSQGRDLHPVIADILVHSEKYLYLEDENMAKDGRRLWIAWTNRPIMEADNTQSGLICAGLDLTARKRTEDALRQSEERFRAAYEHAPMGIMQVDLDGRLMGANATLCQMLGYSSEELRDKTVIELTCPDDRAEESRILKQMGKGELTRFQKEKRFQRKGGRPVWVRETASLTLPPQPYMLAVIEDITERKKAEAFEHERSFLRQVIDAAPSMIFVKNWEGHFVLANTAMARFYGTTVEGMLGRSNADINADADEAAHFWSDDHQVMAERREMLIPEEKVTHASGEVHWFSTIKVPLINEDGTCDKVLAVASDFTERKQAEEALRRSEEQYRNLLETIPLMIWTIQPDGVHDFCNHYWHDYTGLTLEETRYDGWARVEHPDDAPATLKAWHEALQAGRSLDTEGRLRRASDGAFRWHYIRIIPVRDEDQRIIKWIGTAVDVHERRMAQEAVRDANTRLATANRQKDEFLAMLAHELRNPLAPIRNAVEVLRMIASREPAIMRQQNIIDRQVSHMARLLEDLLDISRITRGTVTLKKKPVAVAEVIARSVETVAPLVESRRHALEVKAPPEALLVEGDIDRLTQVVANLLANAAKYTDEGGHLWLESYREGEQAVISVRDSGIGIAPEMLPHVFELFTQADQSLAHSRGGLGIGLTMVQRLVKLHGGTVEGRSEGLGQGSEFIVRLPVMAGPAANHAPLPAPAEARGGGTNHARRCRILVVDDVADSAASLAELLQLWGHETRQAPDGPAALASAREFHPEVVLLDIGMPFMDGYEVARRLRAEYGPGMALVALTGYGQSQDRDSARAAGFDYHMVKPVDINALRDLLDSIMVSHAYGMSEK